MMKKNNIILPLKKSMEKIYTVDGLEAAAERYERLTERFAACFGGGEAEYFSAPGRTEILGNHTDHNGGKVLAASICMDTAGAARVNGTEVIRLVSEGYERSFTIELGAIERIPKDGGTLSLLAGLCEGFRKFGKEVHGFDAYVASDVIGAAGVSSSASFEMLVCSMISYFFNQERLSALEMARIGQYAEHVYWNKQSGLMDQLACAVGGTIYLDFKSMEEPLIEKVDFTFEEMAYKMVIVNTGKGHADLSREYSSVPEEMKRAAQALGFETLSETQLSVFLNRLPEVRKKAGDRAVLRALHFFEENRRVEEAVEALGRKEYGKLTQAITRSGNSSWKWLQNCVPTGECMEQSVPAALAVTEIFLDGLLREKGRTGCCRVHGGGFAGVILCILPKEDEEDYIRFMESFVGRGNIYPMEIRKTGAVHLEKCI